MKNFSNNSIILLIPTSNFFGTDNEPRNMDYDEVTLTLEMRESIATEKINLVCTAREPLALQTEQIIFNDADYKIKTISFESLSLINADVREFDSEIPNLLDFKNIFDFVTSEAGEKITAYARKALDEIENTILNEVHRKKDLRTAIVAHEAMINALYHILPIEEGHHDGTDESLIEPGEIVKINYSGDTYSVEKIKLTSLTAVI